MGRVELVKRVGYIVRTNYFTLYMNPLNNGPKTEVKQVSDYKQKEQKNLVNVTQNLFILHTDHTDKG